jgi:hypothetical protein
MLCYPLFSYAASTLYPQSLGTLLFLAVIFVLLRFPHDSRAALAAGLGFGFLVLTIPSFLLLLPILAGVLLLVDRPCAFASLRRPFFFVISAFLVVIPWTARNYLRLHAFVPISTNTGINLLLGNSPNTTASSGVNVDISEFLRPAESMDEVERDRFFKHSAVAFAKRHPGRVLGLYLEKVASYFHFRNRLSTASESSRFRDAVMFLAYYPLLLCALARLALFRRLPLTLAEGFLYTLYFGNALTSAIFFTRIRFRIPFDAVLIALVAAFFSLAISRRKNPAPP